MSGTKPSLTKWRRNQDKPYSHVLLFAFWEDRMTYCFGYMIW